VPLAHHRHRLTSQGAFHGRADGRDHPRDGSIYIWRKRFGGFQANEVRRLKQLEAENALVLEETGVQSIPYSRQKARIRQIRRVRLPTI
jgi:hypothetical protein